MTGCGSTRSVNERSRVQEFLGSSTLEFRDSVNVESVATCDSVVEVTTVTIRENEQGDTLRMTTVTDRMRIRDRERMKDVQEHVVTRTDTVYVERRDSVLVSNTNVTNHTDSKGSRNSIVQVFKWAFRVIIAVIVLMVLIKVGRIFGI